MRLPGGLLTPAQLEVLAGASADLGDGRLELTSRGNIQIRALRPGAPRELSDRLYDAGLLPSISHERIRNILASPLSGLDQHSLYDVLTAAGDLDRQLCARTRFAELPGRFLFALDDGRGDLARAGADVAIQMVSAEQGALVLAGRDTGIRLGSDEVVPVMLAAAEAFLDEREAQQSSAWRLAELENGDEAVVARLDMWTGSGERMGSGGGAATGGQTGGGGAATGGGGPATAGRVGRAGALPSGEAARAGLHGQGDGRVALVVTVPLGSLEADQVAALVELGPQQLRVTPWRSVVLTGLTEPAVGALHEVGLVTDAGSPWNKVTACAGKPSCAKALADVRSDARRLTPRQPKNQRPVHWSGCERRCGKPAGEFVDVLAVGDGYSVDGSPAVAAELTVMGIR
ncbi:precorrin-3B synthase [Kribbella sp. VKM Ac-2527]|uniref:Precorrin-3B synthase n=1 Tax=Kribbella caucasensis TaxID=2512215 RepID=A0A4R6KR82_9ACTN|nr:precorrin-3B synthase [Kribbella sp. VKM Ac-2527]